jgi:hypothetical protein
MKVKICPNCGELNKVIGARCKKCDTILNLATIKELSEEDIAKVSDVSQLVINPSDYLSIDKAPSKSEQLDTSTTLSSPRKQIKGWPNKPWLSIWIRPRTTIRAIIDSNPNRFIILLALFMGMNQGLNRVSSIKFWDDSNISINLPTIIIISLIIGAIGGIVSLYFFGALYRWVGSLFGGRANSSQVRAAFAWASIPSTLAILLWIPNLALYGGDMFTDTTPLINSNPIPFLCLSTIDWILYLWSLVLIILCISEVHRISIWRSIITFVTPALILLIFGYVISMVF